MNRAAADDSDYARRRTLLTLLATSPDRDTLDEYWQEALVGDVTDDFDELAEHENGGGRPYQSKAISASDDDEPPFLLSLADTHSLERVMIEDETDDDDGSHADD